MVTYMPIFVLSFLFLSILWCAHVTEMPEDSKIIVFRSGIWNGLIAMIPKGGQIAPNSIFGDSLL